MPARMIRAWACLCLCACEDSTARRYLLDYLLAHDSDFI